MVGDEQEDIRMSVANEPSHSHSLNISLSLFCLHQMNEQGIRGGDKNKQGNIRANADLRLVHLLIFLLLCPTPTDMNVQGINLWESGTGRRKIRESASERTFSSSRSNLFSNLWTNCTGQITQKKIDTCWPV